MHKRIPRSAFLSLLYVVSTAAAQPVSSGLKIVVLKGEEAVNIIQQKTAVAPLVEVRDRNNLPVPGAVVTFAVQGGNAATFGGASTLTLTTNAAGQAVAAGFTPVASGAVNITVEAAFQGQLATAAITQVNVMTAAEAAAAAGGAAGGSSAGGGTGGAAAGGGGLSGTTIGVIGAAVAGGAVAATKVVGKEEEGTGSTASLVKNFAGAFSMDVVVVLPACTRAERYAGTLEMQFRSTSDDPSATILEGGSKVTGGTADVVSTTCTGGQLGRIGPGWGTPATSLAGTLNNITFSSQDTVQALDGSGPINRTFTFTGSLSGSTITGTFTMTWAPPQAATWTGRAPVTLTRTQ